MFCGLRAYRTFTSPKTLRLALRFMVSIYFIYFWMEIDTDID